MLCHLHLGLPTLGPQLWEKWSVADGLLCHVGQALHGVYADLQMTLSCPSSSLPLSLSLSSVLNILVLRLPPLLRVFCPCSHLVMLQPSPCYVVLSACPPPPIPPTPRPEPQGLQCWPCWAGPQGCWLPLRLGQIWVGGRGEGEPQVGRGEGDLG